MAEQDALEEGISLYNRMNYTGALSFFLSLPQDSGADPVDLAYYLGLCYAKLKRYDDAMIYLEQVVTAFGGDSASQNGNRASSAKKTPENDRLLQCRYLLAIIYSMTGRQQLADFELNNLMKSGYKAASLYASFAYSAWEKGDTATCISYYEKALAADENNPTALNGLGYVLASQNKDLAKALSYCKKALSLAPDSAACLDSIGWVYYKMGLYSQARKYLEQAKRKDSENEVISKHLYEAEQVDQ